MVQHKPLRRMATSGGTHPNKTECLKGKLYKLGNYIYKQTAELFSSHSNLPSEHSLIGVVEWRL